MSFHKTISFIAFLLGIVGAASAAGDASSYIGYNAVLARGNYFIVAGTDGRIDRIEENGTISKTIKINNADLNCIAGKDQTTFVAGSGGQMFYSDNDTIFNPIDSKNTENIYSLVYFRDKIIAGSANGLLSIGDKQYRFMSRQTEAKGDIVSLAATDAVCYGVTNLGEIVHSTDGINWKVFHFNDFYAGYYQPCSFSGVFIGNNCIAVCGMYKDGTPALVFSSQGDVWTERTLSYNDASGRTQMLQQLPNAVMYDDLLDVFVLACNRGTIMSIPSCSHCNEVIDFSTENHFKAIAQTKNITLMVGENFCIKKVSR